MKGSRELALRRDDRCAVCGSSISARTRAWWDADAKTVTCLACRSRLTQERQPGETGEAQPAASEAPLELGHAGASAQREYERRRDRREARVRAAHPHIGGLLLALGEAPETETAWSRGSRGEAAVGESLDARTADGPAIVLRDRRIPPGRGNIDFLAIAPTGVYVIDAKDIAGKVRIDRPWFGRPKLMIKGHDRTKLVDGIDHQVTVVRRALSGAHSHVPVCGVFCFTQAELPLLQTLEIRGHRLLYRKALAKRLNAPGPLDAGAIEMTARTLAQSFPVA